MSTPAEVKTKDEAHASLVKRLYGAAEGENAREIRSKVRLTFERLESAARHRGRPDEAAALQKQARAVEAYFTAHKVRPTDADAILTAHLEHLQYPRGEAARQQRWNGPFGREKLIQDHGGTDAGADAALANAHRFLADMEKEVPDFAATLRSTGAAEHVPVINTLAAYAPAATADGEAK